MAGKGGGSTQPWNSKSLGLRPVASPLQVVSFPVDESPGPQPVHSSGLQWLTSATGDAQQEIFFAT